MRKSGALSGAMIDHALSAGWREMGRYSDWNQGDMVRTAAKNQYPKSYIRMRYESGRYVVESKK